MDEAMMCVLTSVHLHTLIVTGMDMEAHMHCSLWGDMLFRARAYITPVRQVDALYPNTPFFPVAMDENRAALHKFCSVNT